LAREGGMNKILEKLFLAGLVFALIIFLVNTLDANAISAIKLELSRYDNINTSHIWLVAGFVVLSFGMGWIYSKLNRLDRA
jgi:hypothetical protein